MADVPEPDAAAVEARTEREALYQSWIADDEPTPYPLTWYPSLTQTEGKRVKTSFESLALVLSDVREGSKLDQCMISAPMRGPRRKDNVLGVHIAIFDIDGCGEGDLERVAERLRNRGVAFALVSSYSHGTERGEGVYRAARLLVPLHAFLLREDWDRLWPALNAELALGLADKGAKDASRGFFYGAAKHPERAYFASGAGEPFDAYSASLSVEQAEALSLEAEVPECAGHRYHREDLGKALKQLPRGSKQSEFSKFWTHVYEGSDHPLVEERNTFLLRATRWGAGALDQLHARPGDVLGVMGATLSQMRARWDAHGLDRDGLDDAAIERLIRTAGEEERKERARDEAFRAALDTMTEIAQLRAEKRAEEDPHRPDATVFHLDGRMYFLALQDGGIAGPFSPAGWSDAAHQRGLFPKWVPGPEGRPVTLPDGHLKGTHGAHGALERVCLCTFSGQPVFERTASNGVAMTFSRVPTPLGEPKFHPDIQQWLESTFSDRVFDWVAVLGERESAAPALWLTGPAGYGKSLLAVGCAQAVGVPAPLSGSVAFGRFTDVFANNPLVFLDEDTPTNASGATDVETLKRLISDTRRTVEPKGLAPFDLIGALRVILASNNLNAIQASKDLSPDDLGALEDRIIHESCAPETAGQARAFFAARNVQRDWIDSGAIGRHFRWLASQRSPARGARFRLDGHCPGLRQALALGAGGRDAARIWSAIIRGVLRGPEGHGLQAWGADAKHFWVTADQARGWVGDGRSPEKIGRVLKRAGDPEIHAGGKRVNGRLLSGGRRKIWKIAREALIAHAEHTGEADGEELTQALDRAAAAL